MTRFHLFLTTGLVALGLGCGFIVDTCACTQVPPLDIAPDLATVAVGDSVRVVSLSGHVLEWRSRDETVATARPPIGTETFVVGESEGTAVVIGRLNETLRDSVLVTVTGGT